MATIQEYYNTGDTNHSALTTTQWVYQSFTPGTVGASSYAFARLGLKLWAVEGSGNLIVEIRNVSDGKPGSTVYSTVTIAKSTLASAAPGSWVYVNLPSAVNVASPNLYAIVCYTSSGTVAWRRNPLAGYGGGTGGFSTNSGSTWSIDNSIDLMFETYTINPPVITGQSGDQSVTEGNQVTLSVTVTGGAPITYQWYKDLVVISGATSSTHQFYTGFDSAGSYTCIATNVDGSATTTPAIAVTVTTDAHWRSPTAYSDPSSEWSNDGNAIDLNTATFASASVNDQTWSGTLNLTWDDKYVVSKVAFNALKNIGNVATCKVELYYDGIWNSVYDTTTHPDNGWWVITLPIPKRIYQARLSFYDSFGGGGSHTAKIYEFRYYGYEVPVITSQSSSATVQLNDPVSLSVTAEGEPTLTYQWYKDGNILVGETNSTLNFTAGVTSGGSYTCTVTNSYGSATTAAIVITVNVSAPVITSQSSSLTSFTGFEITLLVVATGIPTPTYQWYKNSIQIGGATNSTYTFFAGSASVDVYSCRVTNALGYVDADPIIITIAGQNPYAPSLFNVPLDLSFED